MIVYTILLVTVLLAAGSIGLMFRPLHWSRVILAVALALFVHLYGAWVYLSFYAKYVFDAAFIIAALVGILHRKNSRSGPALFRTGLNLFLSVVFGVLSVLYFTGTRPAPDAVTLAFPFKAGDYFVLQGGHGYPSNFFHAGSRHAIYALDIVKLNAAGQRSSHIFSQNLNDYFIFADTIYSPCAGRVQRTIDDNPDNIPPDRTRGAHNLNNVLIEAPGCYVFLGHLKQHCVFVKEGDELKVGTPLGLAGNSGYSLEPHLHIQVHLKGDAGAPWYTLPPVPVAFNGREYSLFQKITAAGY